MRAETENAQINISRIRVGGGVGTAGLIALLLGAMLVDIPALRGNAVWGGAVGVVFGIALILRRRVQPLLRRPIGIGLH